jgi:hypothetical protein
MADDMAKAIVFLAWSDAQFINGANLIVDGGLKFNFAADLRFDRIQFKCMTSYSRGDIIKLELHLKNNLTEKNL